MKATDIIKKLHLEPLPQEGGFFRRVYDSEFNLPDQRPFASAIYYLVTPESFSSLHRLKTAEEIFIFCAGDPVDLLQLSHHGVEHYRMGARVDLGQRPQVVVPAGMWQGTKLATGGAWALLSVVVVPAYLDNDNEYGKREELIKLFPSHEKIIRQYTYD